MSRITELKRDLEAAGAAIEELDAALAEGHLDADEHGQRRTGLEREAGRLYVSLRRAQRAARGATEQPSARAVAAAPTWLTSPIALAAGTVVLVVVGLLVGVLVGRQFIGAAGSGGPGGATQAPPAGMPPSVVQGIELQALRQAVEREDAPTPSLLKFAHLALDQGRLDEARRAYERVLARDARNVEAITHMGGVLLQEGRVDEALAKVEEALAIDPTSIHALWDRTQYLFNAKQDYPGAVKAAEAFLKVLPEGADADNIRKLMAEARTRAR